MHQFDRAYVSPFSKLRLFKRTITDAAIVGNHIILKRKKYLRALFAFSRLYQAHAGRLSKMIYRTLMIIGSHVTVGAPRERGMFGGVR